MDVVALMIASGRPFSDFAMVAAQDYFFGHRLQAAANLLFNLIPLERRATQRQLMAHIERCKRFLDGGGKALIIFPEGTRTRTGEMQPFKRGPAVVSTTLGLPLVPAYIDGTYRSWRKNNWFMRPRHIRVRFGPPVEPIATNESETPFATYRRITEELERRVHELRELTRDGTKSDPHEMVGLGRRADGV
jgi:1-acyl-sn-glycerol-3-phosphate acyltransferase